MQLNVWAYDNLRGRWLTWNEIAVTAGEPAGAALTLTPDPNDNVFFLMQDNERAQVSFIFSPTNTLPTNLPPGAVEDVSFYAWPARHKVMFYARPGLLDQGYDPRPQNPNESHWTSLAAGGTNEITELRIPADWTTNFGQIELHTTGSITVTPTNNFTNQATPLTIVSAGSAGTGVIEARLAGTGKVWAKLNVDILPLRLVPVGIFRMTDSLSAFDTSLGQTDSNEVVIDTLNEIYRKANIRFYDQTTNAFYGTFQNGVNLNYDVAPSDGRFGHTNMIFEQSHVHQWVTNHIGGSLLPILFLRESFHVYPDAAIPPGISRIRGNTPGIPDACLVFTLAATQVQAMVAAHEVGHFLGLHHWPGDEVPLDYDWPDDSGVKVEHLMRPGTPKFWPTDPDADPADTSNWVLPFPGRWMDKESWRTVNDSANNLF